jgi:hypothetical protein
MLTIDNILFKIEQHGVDSLSPAIPTKDKKILKNMAKLVRTVDYVTESQGTLAVKILKENLEHLNFVGSDLIPSLKLPAWSKIFKSTEKIRKININTTATGVSVIEIEASFTKELKKVILNLQKNSEGEVNMNSGRVYYLALTEKNLVKAVDDLKRYNFQKSPKIVEIYEKIKSCDSGAIAKEFDIFHTSNDKLKNALMSDVDCNIFESSLLLNDRKIAFQYTIDKKPEKTGEDALEYKIATRQNHKIFVRREDASLHSLSTALFTLNRLPTLLIFDEFDAKQCIENLKNLKLTLDSLNFKGNVGVYFRFDNTPDGTVFNKLVADYGYNKQLDEHNKIAILSNGKLPKFFIKSNWYPKSVVSFTNHFRNNKTSVYCNSCDLIVYYTTSVPVIGSVDAIV